eukprot:3025459-Pleurochrysis_carterae.AAC.1
MPASAQKIVTQKAFNDITNHTALEFPTAQQDQWKALKNFHDRYETSDSVPNLPITLSAPEIESNWAMERGMPTSW